MTPKVGQDVERQEFFHCCWECRLVVTLEKGLAISLKVKVVSPEGSTDHTPWYLPKGVQNNMNKKACTRMLTAAVFITAPTWQEPTEMTFRR